MSRPLATRSPPTPPGLDNALACRLDFNSAAVFLDVDRGQIHFINSHFPRGFLTSTQPSFSCPITDIKALHIHSHKGEVLTIVTATGIARIPARWCDNYSELRDTLDELVPHNESGFATDDPMMGFVLMSGVLIGVGGGLYLVVHNGSVAAMGVMMVIGGVLGGAASYLLVYLGDRWLKVGLAQPLGFAAVGVMLGAAAGFVLNAGVIDGIKNTMIPACLIGAGLGVIVGFLKQFIEQRKHFHQ